MMMHHDKGLVAFATARSEGERTHLIPARPAPYDDEKAITLVNAVRKKLVVAGSIISNPAVFIRARQTVSAMRSVSHAVLTHRFILAPFKPFCSCRWKPAERLERIVNHLETVNRIGGILCPRQGEVRLLTTLSMLDGNYSVKIDEPGWTNKEGLIALSLWLGADRIFKITFLLQTIDDELVCLVGGIQGRNGPGMLDLYREMTKQMHGLRPRDFIVELHRLFCLGLGVRRVLAVSEASHYVRDHYWGREAVQVRQINLDDVWHERGGMLGQDGWFQLPLTPARKDAEQIPAKKRSLYRRRYELLDLIAPEMISAVRQSIGRQAEVAQEPALDLQARGLVRQVALAG